MGSLVGTMLAKLGIPKLTIYDADTVESHNIPMSAYWLTHVSRPKVEALSEIIRAESGMEVITHPEMFDDSRLSGTVVVCVDTMKARKKIWSSVHLNPNVDLLVDTRIAAELIEVFAVCPCDPDDIEFYEHFIGYSDKQTARRDCGMHGVIYLASRVAGIACDSLTSWWTDCTKKRYHQQLGLETLD